MYFGRENRVQGGTVYKVAPTSKSTHFDDQHALSTGCARVVYTPMFHSAYETVSFLPLKNSTGLNVP